MENIKPLEKLNGSIINKLPFSLIRKGDLVYHEGPFISHFVDINTSEHYLYIWCDCDNLCNRWLIIKVNKLDLLSYLNGNLSQYELIQNNNFTYIIDLDDNINPIQIIKLKTIDIPKYYIPSINSFYIDKYECDECISYVKKLKSYLDE